MRKKAELQEHHPGQLSVVTRNSACARLSTLIMVQILIFCFLSFSLLLSCTWSMLVEGASLTC
jgi:hypothetical protein